MNKITRCGERVKGKSRHRNKPGRPPLSAAEHFALRPDGEGGAFAGTYGGRHPPTIAVIEGFGRPCAGDCIVFKFSGREAAIALPPGKGAE
jgi:hypothetical protein